MTRNFRIGFFHALSEALHLCFVRNELCALGKAMFCYTVTCLFSGDDKESIAARWVRWLKEEHIADVVAGGAEGADIVRMDGDELSYEIRYRFSDRAAFETYERDHAPRLRELGLQAFPLELGLTYKRTAGIRV